MAYRTFTLVFITCIILLPGCTPENSVHRIKGVYDVLPVYTERVFENYWKGCDSCWNPYLDSKAPFSDLTLLAHVYSGSVNEGENECGKLDLDFEGNEEVIVPEGKYCLRYLPGKPHTIAGMTYKNKNIPNAEGKHGSSPFEEYICDFSGYSDAGSFYFRYWLEKGARYKIMGKADAVIVEGNGKWQDTIISPLGYEIYTHHTILWLEDLNEIPTEIYLDDAFFFKGRLSDGFPRENKLAVTVPVSQHPENPHVFFWKGKAKVFVASGEHYGALVNKELDYKTYLATLGKTGLENTRLFLGDYLLGPDDFGGILKGISTLEVAPGQFICPWARSKEPGFSRGGNKFDLDKWDPVYRSSGWYYLMSGGGLYGNLDYTFHHNGYEDGTFDPNFPGWYIGSGDPQVKDQLGILQRFMDAMPLGNMFRDSISCLSPGGRVISWPGNYYAAFFKGNGEIKPVFDLPSGKYRSWWTNILTGKFENTEHFTHSGGEKVFKPYHRTGGGGAFKITKD